MHIQATLIRALAVLATASLAVALLAVLHAALDWQAGNPVLNAALLNVRSPQHRAELAQSVMRAFQLPQAWALLIVAFLLSLPHVRYLLRGAIHLLHVLLYRLVALLALRLWIVVGVGLALIALADPQGGSEFAHAAMGLAGGSYLASLLARWVRPGPGPRRPRRPAPSLPVVKELLKPSRRRALARQELVACLPPSLRELVRDGEHAQALREPSPPVTLEGEAEEVTPSPEMTPPTLPAPVAAPALGKPSPRPRPAAPPVPPRLPSQNL